MAGPLPLAAAQRAVLAHARPLPAEPVRIEDAAGRILAEPARAAVDLPPFDSSAMDGFAVRADDLPGRLRVVGTIETGRPATRAVGAGEAMGIGTGGAVPVGSDAVIPVEYVVMKGNEIVVESALEVGENVRPRGRDVRAGEELVPVGTRLTAGRLGALAAGGVPSVACARRPQVAVLATGSELRPPGSELAPGQIYEANSVLLASAAQGAGAAVTRLEPVADDEAAHRDALERALLGDVLVTSGGVSVGTQDLVRRIERDLGVEEVFWRVAVKPGKPVSFGVRGRTLVFGLPGNPVSALVGFELFVRPALLALQGAAQPAPRLLPGRLAAAVSRNTERDELLRARSEIEVDGVVLEPVSGQESHMIARAAGADALVFVPRGEGLIGAGEPVQYLPLS